MKKSLILLSIIALFISGCDEVDLNDKPSAPPSSESSGFLGETGLFVPSDENGVTIEVASVDDGNAHFFNTTLPDGSIAYFFIVKSPDGKLRAAANGCQVCGGSLQGFRQEGDNMVCNTCGNKYPLNKIATEKGGCNPAPISPDLEVIDGNISIPLSDLENILQFFN